jgi:hypothetical protein
MSPNHSGANMNDSRVELCDEIIARITAAFSGVPRGGITLHEAVVIDHYGSDAERRTARARDAERRWQDVPDTVIESHPSVFSFLCPESFRYYIPAYMVWSLRYHRISDSLSSDFTIYSLTPTRDKGQDRWRLERFEIFSPAQARATWRYLQFMAECSDGYADDTQARFALKTYWNDAANVA